VRASAGRLRLTDCISVEVRDVLLCQPLARNFDLHAADAHRAPHRLAFLARDVLVVFGKVERHRVSAALEAFHWTSHRKKF